MNLDAQNRLFTLFNLPFFFPFSRKLLSSIGSEGEDQRRARSWAVWQHDLIGGNTGRKKRRGKAGKVRQIHRRRCGGVEWVDGWPLGWTPFFSTVFLARLGLVAKAKRVVSERKVRGKL
jgi:hypothetical protein